MTGVAKEVNILIIWDRLGEYHWARISALAAIYTEGQVHVAELGRGDSLYQWDSNPIEGVTHHYLSQNTVEHNDIIKRVRRFVTIIKRHNIKVVAQPGYSQPSYLIYLLLCKVLSIKMIFFAESWYPSSTFKDRLKGWLLNFTVTRFLVSGNRARDFFISKLGQSPQKIQTGYSVVNNSYFRRSAVGCQVNQDYLLCVARYSSEKNLIRLIDAFRGSAAYRNWTLFLVGDGPLRQEISELTRNDPFVELLGWKKYEELPGLYQNAKGVILPSTFEPWGLVVNEAMAAGTPVAISHECGCLPDLKVNERLIFDPNFVCSMARSIDYLYDLKGQERIELVEGQYQIISTLSCSNWGLKMKSLVT